MINLTPRQKEIYDFLISHLNDKGYPPSVREIRTAIGLKSTSTVHGHLKRLEKKGLLKRDPTKPRALEIVGTKRNKDNLLHIPIIKDVLTSTQLLAADNSEDTFLIKNTYLESYKSLFIFKVVDSNMINAGLFPGDLSIFEESSTALHNDIVLAKINNKVKIAKLFIEYNTSILINENYDFVPIAINDFVILGRLRGMFRNFNCVL